MAVHKKKYIIEIPEDKIAEFAGSSHLLMPYMMAGHKGLHDTGLNLIPYTEPDLEQVRKEAYDKGFDAGRTLNTGKYEKGLDDAWEAARKILKANWEERHEMFGAVMILENILLDNTAAEAIEKIRQYEQKQEMDGLRQNIQTIVDQCGYTLDEISEVLKKMKEAE